MTRNSSNQRPILTIARSPVDLLLDVVAIAGILLLLLLTFQSWATLPNTIPVHFDIAGKPDATGSKAIILLFPGLSIVLYLLFTFLRRSPHTFNYPWAITEENAFRQYEIAIQLMNWLRTEVILLFTYIEWQMIQVALDKSTGLGVAFLPIFVIVIFGTVGIYFWQAYQAR
ncbi:DUF1648 domain-containing protein [Coleofasciculus sp. FACHB-129]|uniref:DUF1648 domain-containing protein n=1 Tax=Cyanophyceae TaxID=3028117 RepID=UPI001683F985|nr:DUF1648 domain-containing protein [Coleofasciculus sp. FACHB-129]